MIVACYDLCFEQKTADEMRMSDRSSDVCSSDLYHVGIDIAGRDGVDGDAEFRAVLRQRLGKAVDARFGGVVIDLAILSRLPVDRADIDDPAPAARTRVV